MSRSGPGWLSHVSARITYRARQTLGSVHVLDPFGVTALRLENGQT
jgi:hypothetical protein